MAKSSTSFKPGESGNKDGRSKVTQEMRKLAQTYTSEAIGVLVKLLKSKIPMVRLAAAKEILDRGHGKPGQSIEVTDTGQGNQYGVDRPAPESMEQWKARIEKQIAERKAKT